MPNVATRASHSYFITLLIVELLVLHLGKVGYNISMTFDSLCMNFDALAVSW